jgi:Na+/proline symporter
MPHLLGLHLLDAIVVAVSLVVVLAIGVYVSRSVKGESEFFVSGRTMGPWLQFFLNFGQATDSNGAPTIATEVYRSGVGGMWIGFQTLFITPFLWFTTIWFRRARVITGADLFLARFNSAWIATLFAWFSILTVPLNLGLGNIISYKVMAAMMVKPAAEYTPAEQARVQQFTEFQELKTKRATRGLSPDEQSRYAILDSMAKRHQISSSISYVTPLPFYLAYTAIVAIYIVMGGIKAAAITDAFQGLLIIVFSVMMIPLGLKLVGGFEGLHDKVPDFKFALFGAQAVSDYTWYSIAAIVFGSLVTFGQPAGPSVAAAKNERAIRIGTLSGVFLKRFVMIAWMFCGLLAIALLPGGLSDPDETWGALATKVLPPGLMGLMIAGMLLGHMPAVGVAAVNFSATFTRNLYEPYVRNRSPAHYMFVAQASIVAVLASGILFAMFFTGVIEMLSALITFNAFFGATGFLIYFWRRITAPAIGIGAVIWLVMMVLFAWTLPRLESFRQLPALTLQTTASVVTTSHPATQRDVEAGRATQLDQIVTATSTIDPRSMFFDRVAHSRPDDTTSPLEGLGRFHIENFILYHLGMPLQNFQSAGLITCRWMFDGIFPFIMLIILSYLTAPKPDPEQTLRIARFHARLKTPIGTDHDDDNHQVALSDTTPTRFDHLKLFPRSNWEFTRWDTSDYLGFFGCWAGVGLILLFLYWLLQIGA